MNNTELNEAINLYRAKEALPPWGIESHLLDKLNKDNTLGIESYPTAYPSKRNLQVAHEAIDAKIVALVGAAIAAMIALVAKLVGKLSDKKTTDTIAKVDDAKQKIDEPTFALPPATVEDNQTLVKFLQVNIAKPTALQEILSNKYYQTFTQLTKATDAYLQVIGQPLEVAGSKTTELRKVYEEAEHYANKYKLHWDEVDRHKNVNVEKAVSIIRKVKVEAKDLQQHNKEVTDKLGKLETRLAQLEKEAKRTDITPFYREQLEIARKATVLATSIWVVRSKAIVSYVSLAEAGHVQ